jgi:hypothetical protein
MAAKTRRKQPDKPGERTPRLVGFDGRQNEWLIREAKRLSISVTYLVTLLVDAGMKGRVEVAPPRAKQDAA